MRIAKSKHILITTICLHITLFLVASRKYVFMGRFPGQDLIWNDMQLFRTWNWVSQTIGESGFEALLRSDVDFRLNFGENIYTQAKSTSILFDPGVWIFVFTKNLDLAVSLRLFILSSLCALGIFLLMRQDYGKQVKWLSNVNFFIVFSIIDGFFLFHPQFSYEVGFLNSWFFFLVPMWIFVLYYGKSKSRRYRFITCVILSLMSCALTDVHAIIYVSVLATFTFISSPKSNRRHIINLWLCFSSIFIIDRIPLIKSLISQEEVTTRGVYYPDYLYRFVLELFITPFSYNFAGPVTIFTGFMIPALLILNIRSAGRILRSRIYREFLLGVATFFALVFIGILLHTLPLVSDLMPSLWRYPFAILPFIMASLLAKWSRIVLADQNKQRFLASIIILILPIQVLSINLFTRDNSRVFYNYELRDYFLSKLPQCIDKILLENGLAQNERSIVFAAPKYSDDYPYGNDDSVLHLIENPTSIKSRTFNQWRYGSNKTYIDYFGYNAWPTLTTEKNLIKQNSIYTKSNILISSDKLTNSRGDFMLIGNCKPPFPNDLFQSRNHTLIRPAFIYSIISPTERTSASSKYFSSKATYNLNCAEIEGGNPDELLIIPVAYRDSYLVTANAKVVYIENHEGFVRLPNSVCQTAKQIPVEIEILSNSRSVLIRNIIEMILFLTAGIMGFGKHLTKLISSIDTETRTSRFNARRRMRDSNPR